jgi:hypothetical protein
MLKNMLLLISYLLMILANLFLKDSEDYMAIDIGDLRDG